MVSCSMAGGDGAANSNVKRQVQARVMGSPVDCTVWLESQDSANLS